MDDLVSPPSEEIKNGLLKQQGSEEKSHSKPKRRGARQRIQAHLKPHRSFWTLLIPIFDEAYIEFFSKTSCSQFFGVTKELDSGLWEEFDAKLNDYHSSIQEKVAQVVATELDRSWPSAAKEYSVDQKATLSHMVYKLQLYQSGFGSLFSDLHGSTIFFCPAFFSNMKTWLEEMQPVMSNVSFLQFLYCYLRS